MRHGKKVNHLGRTAPHRKALMANMASSLILHKRINTTLAKAKALRTFVEPLITKSKEDTTHSRRTVFAYLKDKNAVTELFREVSNKIADRPGGYCRIIKLPNRLGDNASMAMIELVDFNEHLTKDSTIKTVEKKTRRGRGGAKKSITATAVPVAEAIDSSIDTPAPEAVNDEPAPINEANQVDTDDSISSPDPSAESTTEQ